MQKIRDVILSKQTVEQNVDTGIELHTKSLQFERDNLQMELVDALKQIDKLQSQAPKGEQNSPQMKLAMPPIKMQPKAHCQTAMDI